MMRTELENIQSLTKNFLKFTNLDKPNFQVYDIRLVIEETLQKYKSYLTEELNIQVTVDPDVKPVWIDIQQIEMVFHILVENALAAVQGKGIISISATMAQYLDKSFSEFVEIELADNGPGIREEDKEKIFEAYFTTKKEGSGMGLAIARKIIRDHETDIDVYSKPNFGAVFRFYLSVAKDE